MSSVETGTLFNSPSVKVTSKASPSKVESTTLPSTNSLLSAGSAVLSIGSSSVIVSFAVSVASSLFVLSSNPSQSASSVVAKALHSITFSPSHGSISSAIWS